MKVDTSRQKWKLQTHAKEGEGRMESMGLEERSPQTKFPAYSQNTKLHGDTTQSKTS